MERSSLPAAALRRPRTAVFARRGGIVLGVALAVLLSAAGGFIGFANTLPTSVTLNIGDGRKDVPTDTQLVFRFTRPVALSSVQAALLVTPTTDGTLTAVLGQTEFEWSATKPLTELTSYTVTISALKDLGHHPVKAAQWTFTTLIVPRVLSVTAPGGMALAEGGEVDPGTPLQINFNDAMDHSSIAVTLSTKTTDLKWTPDDKSAAI